MITPSHFRFSNAQCKHISRQGPLQPTLGSLGNGQDVYFRGPRDNGRNASKLPHGESLAALAQRYPVLDLMLKMIQIPSATPTPRFPNHENLNKMRALVFDSLRSSGITVPSSQTLPSAGVYPPSEMPSKAQSWLTPEGGIVIKVPGSQGYEHCRPLLITAHMDIVPGDAQVPDRPITPQLTTNTDGTQWITSDGTTTLGADDKGGLAMILDTLRRLHLPGSTPPPDTPPSSEIPHAPIEILLSPDEEGSCDSLRKLDTGIFKARQALVIDEFYDFQITNGLASTVEINLRVSGTNGGHSGEDIGKANRLNAIDLLNRLLRKVRTGVVDWHPQYKRLPLISKNLGLISGGSAPNAIAESATATVLLRSFDSQRQEEELQRIRAIVDDFQQKYQDKNPRLAITMEAFEEYPPWQGDAHSSLPPLAQDAARAMGHRKRIPIKPTHAAAQASILANKLNQEGQAFDAILIGPKIEEAHTPRERVDWKSVVQVNEWLMSILKLYAQKSLQAPKDTGRSS